ncbi:MAG: hypothetical protein F9K13_09060 [Candidatus Methylomirabilis oxygeniifera]|uniref:Signal transduction histidine kinase dimerisation/phosphoacceptor domain-containing protein n=1 Tax=Methylomirabilis oxygeniifera TaxID=671143 RepID=D5MGK6_METO1|nr:MAG: hypothetical protein F9K13_09060 [Candidatus Methylomirabilis oxyfera]CBE68887.1 protein of unknown function [Candidatus Methylomirabilis oxyfera]
MKTIQEQPGTGTAVGPNQVGLPTHTDTAVSHRQSTDGCQLKAAVLGQAHWTAVGKLTPGLIHEINNALCVIGNYVQLLMLQREHRGQEILKSLTTMSATVERVQTLTHRVAAYARVKAQPSSSIRVHELLEEALALASLQRLFREFQVHRAFSDNLPEVRGDPRSLMDAFVELLTIDSHAVARGGIVTISTRSAPGWVTVTLGGSDHAWSCSKASLTLASQIVEQQAGRLLSEAGPGQARENISVWLRTSTDTGAA